jgi:hypothetical protein
MSWLHLAAVGAASLTAAALLCRPRILSDSGDRAAISMLRSSRAHPSGAPSKPLRVSMTLGLIHEE